MQTEYRIINHPTLLYDRYLQFKVSQRKRTWFGFGKEKTLISWRFIPKEKTAYVLGKYLDSTTCPRRVGYDSGSNFLGAELGGDDPLNSFVKNHPHIETYFRNLQVKRGEYVTKHSTIWLRDEYV